MRFFRKKISIFTPKNSYDLFLAVNQVFLIFTPFFRFSVALLCKMSYMTLSSQQKALFQKRRHLFFYSVLSLMSDNTTSQNIGGTNAWAVPTSNFGGTVPSVPPRSPPLDIVMHRQIITCFPEVYMYTLYNSVVTH